MIHMVQETSPARKCDATYRTRLFSARLRNCLESVSVIISVCFFFADHRCTLRARDLLGDVIFFEVATPA